MLATVTPTVLATSLQPPVVGGYAVTPDWIHIDLVFRRRSEFDPATHAPGAKPLFDPVGLLDALPPGSYLAVSHLGSDLLDREAKQGFEDIVNRSAQQQYIGRSREQMARFFAGTDLVEPGLVPALRALTPHQRAAVVLVHGHGWQLNEVAALFGVRVSTVQTHVERAMTKLRAALEVDRGAVG